MDHFEYVNGVLTCDGIDVPRIALQFGTPLYLYASRTMVDHFTRFADAFAELRPAICFSVKSCQNLAILRILKDCGASFDVVSGGELARVLEVGADPGKVVFAGVGKTDVEIEHALRAGIAWFNAESEAELENLARIAAEHGKRAQTALRINPDVDPHTHAYTTTGKRETKFGVDITRARCAFASFAGHAGLDLAALHVHIGSPVNRIQPYVEAITKTLELVEELRRAGHDIRAMNIGGGFGAHYRSDEAPTASDYAAQIVPLLRHADLEVLLEPGRSIIANAGVLLARVLYVKDSGDRRFVILDASMTELIRPALYGAFHFAWPVQPSDGMVPPHRGADLKLNGTELVDLVGPVCESGDFLAKDRWLPQVERGDLIAIFSTGAYGFTMASQYNSRPRPAEVLVDAGQVRLIRRRETYDDLVAAERL